MEKIVLEQASKYIEGKTDLVVNGEEFTSDDFTELLLTFKYSNEILIRPVENYLQFKAELVDLKFSNKEKQLLQEGFSKRVIKNEIKKEKLNDFFEKNKYQIYESIYNSIDDDEDEEGSNEVEEPLNEKFKNIAKNIKKVFNNTSVYDNGKSLVFWHTSETIVLYKEQIQVLLETIKELEKLNCNFNFTFIPTFDFSDDENENATGVSFIFKIDY